MFSSETTVSQNLAWQRANDVARFVNNDLRDNCHVTDNPTEFLQTFFPVPDEDKELAVEAAKHLFDTFPHSGATGLKHEKDLYNPFAQLANKILENYSSSKRVKLRSFWKADSEKPPQTEDETASFIRPDAVDLLLGVEDNSGSESILVCAISSPGPSLVSYVIGVT